MNISDLAWPVCGLSCFLPLISEMHYLTALNSQKICRGCDVRKGPQATVALSGIAPQSFSTKAHSALSEMQFSGGAGGRAESGIAEGPGCAWPWGCGREFQWESSPRGALTASTWTQTPSPRLD